MTELTDFNAYKAHTGRFTLCSHCFRKPKIHRNASLEFRSEGDQEVSKAARSTKNSGACHTTRGRMINVCQLSPQKVRVLITFSKDFSCNNDKEVGLGRCC